MNRQADKMDAYTSETSDRINLAARRAGMWALAARCNFDMGDLVNARICQQRAAHYYKAAVRLRCQLVDMVSIDRWAEAVLEQANG